MDINADSHASFERDLAPDERSYQSKKESLPRAIIEELERLERKIDTLSQEDNQEANQIIVKVEVAYKRIQVELEKQPSKTISASVSTLRDQPKAYIQKLLQHARETREEILQKAADMLQDLKRASDTKLAAQIEKYREEVEYYRTQMADISIKNEAESDHDDESVRNASVASELDSVALSLDVWETQTFNSQQANAGAKQQRKKTTLSNQTTSAKGAKTSPSADSVLSTGHWGATRDATLQSRSAEKASGPGSDASKSIADLGSDVEGILRREDELLSDLIQNKGSRSHDGQIPEGVKLTLQALGWKVKELEAENKELRIQLQGAASAETPDSTEQITERRNTKGKFARFAETILSAKSIAGRMLSPTGVKTPDPGRRVGGLLDTPQTTGPKNTIPLDEELEDISSVDGSTAPNTARSWHTPLPRPTVLSARSPKHTPTLAPVIETTNGETKTPKSGSKVTAKSTGMGVLTHHYDFPRFPYYEVPDQGNLSLDLIWCYMINVILGLLEPISHAIFWYFALFQELSLVYKFICWFLDPSGPKGSMRRPGIPLMPARSLTILGLYLVMIATVNVYIATCRERSIWLQANNLTRTYMLKTMRHPQSWMGIPGVDGNLALSRHDVAKKLLRFVVFLQTCYNSARDSVLTGTQGLRS